MFIELEYIRTFEEKPRKAMFNLNNICRVESNPDGSSEITLADGSIISTVVPFKKLRGDIINSQALKDIFGR